MLTNQPSMPGRVTVLSVAALALLLTLCTAVRAVAQLSGGYTINSALPAGGTNYPSFTAAIADLAATGIAGDVTFTVAAGTYAESFTIPAFVNSGNWRVTFDGGAGNAPSRVISFQVSAANDAVITLDGADYVTFRNLTIVSTHGTYGAGILFTNSADFNEIVDCVIAVSTTTSSVSCTGIRASVKTHPQTPGDHGSGNLIQGNAITGGYAGIYWYGHSAMDLTVARGNRFIGNTISDFFEYGMYCSHGAAFTIRGNAATQRNAGVSLTSHGYGIYALNMNDGPEISGNYGRAAVGGVAALFMNRAFESAANRARFSNNMSIAEGTGMAYGLMAFEAKNADIVFNSCRAKSTTGTVYGYQCNVSTANSDVRVVNNMVSCETQGIFHAMNNLSSVSNPYAEFDYNILFETGSSAVHRCIWNGTDYGTFANLRSAAVGFHAHSFEADPMWLGAADLHSLSPAACRAGISVAGFADDYDGEPRDAAPCIGADEFVLCAITCPADITTVNDAGLCGATVTFTPTVTQGCGILSCSPPSGSFFPAGTTTVQCVTAAGPQCSFDVTVTDAEAPLLAARPPITLWPANHNYATITVAQMVEAVSDNCTPLSAAEVRILAATSDEPETGGGTGNTLDDIMIANDCQSVDLRKERSGAGHGRVYKITLRVTDLAGNFATAVFTACVPTHPGGDCVEGSVLYAVNSTCGISKSGIVRYPSGGFDLEQNFPNPFNPTTNIAFTIPEDSHVLLRVHDAYGRIAAILVDGMLAQGAHQVVFDAANLSSGTYVCRLEAGSRVLQRNIVLIK